jgi:hypothetical protein
MSPSAMCRRVALVVTDVSEELITSIIRVERVSELGTTLTLTSNSETSVLTRATWRHIPEDGILLILVRLSTFYSMGFRV